MKKNIKRLASFVFSLAMIASSIYTFHPCPVQAAEASNPIYTLDVKYSCGYDTESWRESCGDPIAVVPDLNVNFELKAGKDVAAGSDSQLPLKAGIMDGIENTYDGANGTKKADYTVSFKSSDYSKDDLEKYRTKQNPKIWSDISGHVNTSDKTQEEKLSIDFSKVKFPGPGIYNYVLSVKSPNNIKPYYALNEVKSGIAFSGEYEKHNKINIYDDINIFVYVTQNDDNTLSVNALSGGSGDSPYKDNSNSQVSKTESIQLYYYWGTGFSIDKGVTGNMGDKSEYFAFDVHLENLGSNVIYHINTKAAAGPDSSHNDEYFISDDKGKADVKVRLKNGDDVVFAYLPKGAKYTIREEKKGGYDTLIGWGGAVEAIYTSLNPYYDDLPPGLEYNWGGLEHNEVYGYYKSYWNNIKKIKLSQKEKPLEIYGTDDSGKQYKKTVTEVTNKYIVGSYNENNESSGESCSLYTTSGADSFGYINVRNGVLPTGIVLNNLPAIFSILSVALMAVIIFLTRKKPSKKQ